MRAVLDECKRSNINSEKADQSAFIRYPKIFEANVELLPETVRGIFKNADRIIGKSNKTNYLRKREILVGASQYEVN